MRIISVILVCCLMALVKSKPVSETEERNLLKDLLNLLDKKEVKVDNSPRIERKGIPLMVPSDKQENTEEIRGKGQSFGAGCVKAHNILRKYHSSPPVSWSNTLASGATAWAKHLATLGSLVHSVSNGAYGENLYYAGSENSSPSKITCANSCFTWYQEYKNYSYKKAQFGMTTGHFTQVVWKATTQIGCGIASKKEQTETLNYIVCRYKVAGNMEDEFATNVVPPNPNPAPVGSYSDLL